MGDNIAFKFDLEKQTDIPRVEIKDKSIYSDVTNFFVNSDASSVEDGPNFREHTSAVSVEACSPAIFSSTQLDDSSQVRLTWNNLSVSAIAPKKLFGKAAFSKQEILKGITGYAEPGSLLAIMGSSGAGKSTLLNVLTWRNLKNLKVKGEILANGVAMGPDITSISAYVQQDDLFMGELTVKEHLTFSARLRMDGKLSDGARSKRVEEVMQQMGLKKCENVRIGTPGTTKTISGGEMKRLSFAAELLNKPPILFCDEPTSGLDSYLAKVIVECMRTVARQGCTVLCTIHQPSSEVFELFDRLLLLALGRVVYHGEASQALRYYERVGYPCPSNYNPSDHYIMVVSVRPGDEADSKKQIQEIQDFFCESEHKKEIDKEIESFNSGNNANQQTELLTTLSRSIRKQQYRVGFLVQFYACLVRALKCTYRNPTLTYVKVMQQLFAAVIIGLIFLRENFLENYLSSDVRAVIGSLFIVIVNNTFSCAMGVMNTFPSEIPLFRRDHFNGMYSTAVYFITKNLADFPTYVILPLVYTVVVYFMFGLYPSAVKFFIFFGYLVLMCHTCVSYGYMISTMSPNVTIALAIGPALIMPLLLLGGFFIPNESVPDFMAWIKYISWFYYTNELLNINQWEDVGYLGCPLYMPPGYNGTLDQNTPCIYKNGEAVLEELNFSKSYVGRDIGLMFALLVGYRTIALATLYFRVRESTR